MQQMNRIAPLMPAGAYKTFTVVAPLSTHFRPATCAEVECDKYLNGWRVRTDTLDEQMIHTATHAGRKFQWLHVSEMENWLVYEAGQACFQASTHRTRVDKPELFIVRDGDWRGNPRGTEPEKHNADTWVDSFAHHQDKLSQAHQAG